MNNQTVTNILSILNNTSTLNMEQCKRNLEGLRGYWVDVNLVEVVCVLWAVRNGLTELPNCMGQQYGTEIYVDQYLIYHCMRNYEDDIKYLTDNHGINLFRCKWNENSQRTHTGRWFLDSFDQMILLKEIVIPDLYGYIINLISQ